MDLKKYIEDALKKQDLSVLVPFDVLLVAFYERNQGHDLVNKTVKEIIDENSGEVSDFLHDIVEDTLPFLMREKFLAMKFGDVVKIAAKAMYPNMFN